ncbi:MAG: UDP-N-acetylglucosamine 2-epimerase, partial [Desulfobulbaceae bacterium]|nr:UDP-N-acetylglucosamine 2-epimerase [Desulfobulbaceae bacterium]
LAVVTYHPETMGGRASTEVMEEIIDVLDGLPDLRILFTAANADAGGKEINACIESYAADHPAKALYVPSLGQRRYFSLLRYADLMVGNSSSGIIEAASFALPVVNIGERQRGRVRSQNIIDVPDERKAIEDACVQALSPSFRERAAHATNQYEKKNTTFLIMEILQRTDTHVRTKEFYDPSSR